MKLRNRWQSAQVMVFVALAALDLATIRPFES